MDLRMRTVEKATSIGKQVGLYTTVVKHAGTRSESSLTIPRSRMHRISQLGNGHGGERNTPRRAYTEAMELAPGSRRILQALAHHVMTPYYKLATAGIG